MKTPKLISSEPLVSVILPIFNGEKWLPAAIASIQKQTLTDWELIIVDDGSEDASLQQCQKFAQDDCRIQVHRNPANLGLAKSMNRLVSLAQGQYIAVQEQDDVSLPERLEREVRLLETKTAVYLVSGIAAWINERGEVFTYFPGHLQQKLPYPSNKQAMVRYLYTEQCKIVNAACMFRREILSELPVPFDERAKMSIDWQFFLHVAHRWQIMGIPEVLVNMRRGGQHAHLTARKDLQFAEARRCIRLIYQMYKDDPTSPINYRLYRQAMVTQLVLEGRYYGRTQGLLRLVQAAFYDPADVRIWISIREMGDRLVSKFN